MELHKVILLKTDTCLTYSLRRIGKSELINNVNYENIHDYFISFQFTEKMKNNLNVGDLLLWQRDAKYIDMPWEIDIDGRILWHRKIVGSHVAVYEGTGIISDNTRLINPPHPNIRVRKLEQLNKMPDYVLRYSNNNN
jgi:hypothetical protein